jgi:hypothetical protein
MKKVLYIMIAFMAIAVGARILFHRTDVASFLIRSFANYDLGKKGILLEYGYVAPGLHKSPFILPFTGSLQRFSLGRIDLDVINSFTVGNYEKDPRSRLRSVSNFLDPTSKFKDSWFGVYIILDDPLGRGKRFILNDPAGPPGDLSNLKRQSLLELPRIDQMIVVHSTHQNQKVFDSIKFLAEFPFKKIENPRERVEIIKDKNGSTWLEITSQYSTVSALTDTFKTDMHELYSIKAYVGLPDKEVYDLADPWHKIIIKGSLLARYFPCAARGFWAVVYFNGSSFTDKKGMPHDPWEKSDIKIEFEKMFQSLRIGCK